VNNTIAGGCREGFSAAHDIVFVRARLNNNKSPIWKFGQIWKFQIQKLKARLARKNFFSVPGIIFFENTTSAGGPRVR
jgi:hypothetical protein